MSETTWLSQSAYDRLSDELQHLKTVGRVEASHQIEVARAHGDLKENAEYHSAKEEQGKMEARIRQLEQMLRDAKVGEAPTGDAVAAGMVVTIEVEDGDIEEFLLGSREDRIEGLDTVSAASVRGKALLGAKVGDVVTYAAPGGTYSMTVTGVRPLNA